jgi:hypothetical protein
LGFAADNNAAGFDASDGSEAIVVANPANSVFDARTGDLSFSLWFKGPNDGGDYMLLSKMNGSRDGYSLERLPGSGSTAHKLNPNISADANTPGIGPLGPVTDPAHWTNAVVVLHRNRTSASADYASSGASLFVNGVWFGQQASSVFDGSPGIDMKNSLPLLIGAFRQSADGWLLSYTGSIDDVSVYNRALSPTEIAQLYNIASTGAQGAVPTFWRLAGGGNWSASGSWQGAVPQGADSVANFTGAIAGASTVSLDSPFTVGTINFSNPSRYTIGGPGTLTISSTTSGAINIMNGNHTILAPLNLQSNTTVNTPASNQTLTLSGLIRSGPSVGLTKVGAGTLLANQGIHVATLDIQQGTTRIGAGTVQLNEPARTSVVKSLSIANSAGAYTARFDLGNSSAIIDYDGASPAATIGAMLKQGYANGAWSGLGIASNQALATSTDGTKLHKTALGYVEASAVNRSTFSGETVPDSTAILIGYTLYGDANVDFTVNALDFNALATSYGSASSVWSSGDFNYDGMVNSSDFSALSQNFNSALGVPPLGTLVPEPSALAIVLAGGALLGRRKRALHNTRG